MKIIVVGCGKVGSKVTENLVAEGHDVVVIDIKETVVNNETNSLDIMGVVGNGVDYETLQEAGVADCELFIAMTSMDEFNMLSCYLARKMGAKHTVARIRTPAYNDHNIGFMRQQLDISMVMNPEQMSAHEIQGILKLQSSTKVESFSRSNFYMMEARVKSDSILNGVMLKDIHKKMESNFLVGVVQRNNDVIVPDGSFVLQEGDRIGLTVSRPELDKLISELHYNHGLSKNVMIIGAGRISHYLAKALVADGSLVKIIDNDLEACQVISEAIPEAVVIHGNGTNQDLLKEEGIAETDAVVCLTGEDERNILISIFAKSVKVPKVITKANTSQMVDMAENLGLECIISPKRSVSNVLVRYARALQNSLGSKVETLYKLLDGKAEALEFIVNLNFEHSGIPLKDLKFIPNTLIGGIIRGRQAFIPKGNDYISAGDHVIVITTQQHLNDLDDIIR